MAEDADSDSPKQPRSLPRAARLSRIQPSPPETLPVETLPVETQPTDTKSVEVPGAHLAPPDVADVPDVPRPAARDDVVDLANAIANSTTEPRDIALQTPPGPTVGAPKVIEAMSLSRLPASGAPSPSAYTASAAGSISGPQSASGVSFKPLADSWANRSVILSSLGLVLCFFPVLSLAGMLLGLMSLRRIAKSGGALIGAKTARFGAVLGGVGVLAGVVVDVVFLLTR